MDSEKIQGSSKKKNVEEKRGRLPRSSFSALSDPAPAAPALSPMPSRKITLEEVMAIPTVFGSKLDSQIAKVATRRIEMGPKEFPFEHDIGRVVHLD